MCVIFFLSKANFKGFFNAHRGREFVTHRHVPFMHNPEEKGEALLEGRKLNHISINFLCSKYEESYK